MEIESTQKQSASIVSIKGRIDAMTASEFENVLSALLEDRKIHIVLDLNAVDYVSSAGLRAILTVAKQLKALQGQMAFFGLQGSVKEVFEISGFCSILPIFDSEEEALRSI